MAKETLGDKLREWIAGIAFAVYLWASRMTEEEFLQAHERQARRAIAEEQINAGSQTPPMRTWQNEETGRITEAVIQPGERWYEVFEC